MTVWSDMLAFCGCGGMILYPSILSGPFSGISDVLLSGINGGGFSGLVMSNGTAKAHMANAFHIGRSKDSLYEPGSFKSSCTCWWFDGETVY